MFLKSQILSRYPGIIHGFTTRKLGDNYARIAAEIGVSENDFFTPNQVHSSRVYFLSDLSDRSDSSDKKEGDAIVSRQKGILLAVRTADCVPLLVYDPINKAVAAIHAGWRGLNAGIIENSIKMMQEKFLTDPKNLVVALGPALCPGCFEIGPEVAEAFRKKFGNRITVTSGKKDRYFVDLRKGCELALGDNGVMEEHLEFLPYCTACHRDLFYSYRNGDKEERMMGFIGLVD